jgi:riboflavin kinase/FMN adenylyltransferase
MDRSTVPLLLRYPAAVPAHLRGGVVTLGNFDGVHLGHRHVIAALHQVGQGLPTVVVSFYPHPVRVLRGDKEPRALSSLREKREHFGELGIQLLYGIHFTKAFSLVSAKDFIEQVLVKALGAKILVVGEDVAVGHKREGNLGYLQSELPNYGIALYVVPKFLSHGERPSSRRIRELLITGDVRGASALLGAPFTVSARVGHGDKRGQKIGFPTANVMCGTRLLPKRGVYACRVQVGDDEFDGVANIGVRPTFNGVGERLEVHILNQRFASLYGKRLHVRFIDRLRDEKKFNSLEELTTQIKDDIVTAERRLRDVR